MPSPRRAACPLDLASIILGRRWVLLVLREILNGPQRFNELRKALPRLPAKSLSRVLRGLEESGLVERRIASTRPPGVSYALARQDPLLLQIIQLFSRWGSEHFKPQGANPSPPRSKPKR